MISTQIKGVDLQFETDPANFSPAAIDKGTCAMLSRVEFQPTDKVLDLGCGYGVVGILAGKLIGSANVILSDLSEKAVKSAKINAALNQMPALDIRLSAGYQAIPEKDFTLILSNPPYHANFSVPKRFIEIGFKKLVVGGKLVMVTKRLDWYQNKLTTIFGGVKVEQIDGYYVFTAEKRSERVEKEKKPVQQLSKKLKRKYEKAR